MDVKELDSLVSMANEPPVDLGLMNTELDVNFPRAGRALNQVASDVIGSAVALSDRVIPTAAGELPRQRCVRVGKAVRISGALCMLVFMALEMGLALAAVNAYMAVRDLVRFAHAAGANTI